MSDSIYARENVIQFPVRRAVKRDARRQTQYDALIDQLQAAHAREKVWLREKSDLLQRHVTLSQEFEHRLANSLQMIVSVLSLQSRTASLRLPRN
jgi:two-component system, sensor histidine kinase PdtaS